MKNLKFWPERQTKLFMSLLVFLVATVFRASGIWMEEALVSEGTWMSVSLTVLGMYSAANVAVDFVHREKSGGKDQ